MPIELTDIRSGYNLSAINENFQRIEREWDEKLDRLVSTQGNQMEQSIDMNGNRIINSPAPTEPTHLARLQDIVNLTDITGAIPSVQPRQQGDGVERVFNTPASTSTFPQSFLVNVNGLAQRPGTDFSVLSDGRLSFTTAPANGANVDITWFEPRITENPDASARTVLSNGTTNARSLSARFADIINVEDFGAVGDGVTDDTSAIQAAIDYVASLTGSSHEGSQSFGSRIGDSRAVALSPKRYAVSSTILLKNNVSLLGNKGSLVALTGFAAASPVLSTDGERFFSAPVKDVIIDGNNLNVKGIVIDNILATEWSDITVLNCRNDGITMESGADFVLNGFFVSCAEQPLDNTIAGLRTAGSSDAAFSNGICRFSPVGVAVIGGGNNEFSNIHCWGGYADRFQYINFYIKNSFRNTFTSMYADSPTKQDYAQSNTAVVNGFPNGGVCFYLEREGTIASGSQSNQFVNCRPFANRISYDNAGITGRHLLFAFIDANCFFNQFVNTVRVDGPARVPFLEEAWSFWNNDIQRSTTLFNNENPQIQSLALGDGTSALYSDTGSPEGSVTANPGSLYMRTDGGVGTSLYVKESGIDTNTGWVSQGDLSAESFHNATIGTAAPIARITPVGFGVTRVEVTITATETAAYVGNITNKYVFLIRTTSTTDVTAPVEVSGYRVTNSNANYNIDATLTAVHTGNGVTEVRLLITESGALNPTEANVKWTISADSTRVGLQIVPV